MKKIISLLLVMSFLSFSVIPGFAVVKDSEKLSSSSIVYEDDEVRKIEKELSADKILYATYNKKTSEMTYQIVNVPRNKGLFSRSESGSAIISNGSFFMDGEIASEEKSAMYSRSTTKSNDFLSIYDYYYVEGSSAQLLHHLVVIRFGHWLSGEQLQHLILR